MQTLVWKKASIIAIHKNKGDKYCSTNYRPVILISDFDFDFCMLASRWKVYPRYYVKIFATLRKVRTHSSYSQLRTNGQKL